VWHPRAGVLHCHALVVLNQELDGPHAERWFPALDTGPWFEIAPAVSQSLEAMSSGSGKQGLPAALSAGFRVRPNSV
jgi:hypothetical protein